MNSDVIKLDFPAKPDYILAIRLAVSAIAERAGFGIEDIEDIKVATAEGCMLLLSSGPDSVLINITVKDGLSIELSAVGQTEKAAQDDDSAELSRCLLEALVDSCDFTPAQAGGEGVMSKISFYKKL